ncbi:MAG: DUF1080 domain-containing protein [Deinococcales bacterium]|nr:DUF1080 domain-containing protein [Chitinophagaceae bacterium]
MKQYFFTVYLFTGFATTQVLAQGNPRDTEVWSPIPKIVITDKLKSVPPPADAVVLFSSNNLDKWVSTNDVTKPADWLVKRNIFTVNKKAGNIQTKQSFTDYQLHIEWRIPENITGEGQGRGNSGLFLASTGPGDEGYEIQILDCYNNQTYVNGQTGSVYKQAIPLANACKKPGEWQAYDIVWKAPRFNTDGSLEIPAYVTVIHNGVVLQNNTALKGATTYIGKPSYKKHGASPIKLQSHGDPSEPISFRNIWIREL